MLKNRIVRFDLADDTEYDPSETWEPKRWWLYPRDSWEWPHWYSLFSRGSDEFNNYTLVTRTPFGPLIVVTNLRLGQVVQHSCECRLRKGQEHYCV